MINLMPPEHKLEITYARRNSFMIRWLAGIGIATIGIAVIALGGMFYLRQDSKSYQQSIATTKERLEKEKEAETLDRAEEMSGNLQLVQDVLSKEILFSKLLQHIGQILPPGTVLESLSLTNELQGGLDLEVGAQSYETGVRAQVNLADPNNRIFQQADIGQVTCASGEEAAQAYPCKASVRVLFMKDNNIFLKLNQGGGQS